MESEGESEQEEKESESNRERERVGGKSEKVIEREDQTESSQIGYLNEIGNE